MGVRENKVERHLASEVEKLGGMTRKWVSPGFVGVPDQIVIIKRTVAEMIAILQTMEPSTPYAEIKMVEVKTVDGKLSSWQVREIKRLQSHGVQVHVVFGEEGVDKIIEDVRNAY